MYNNNIDFNKCQFSDISERSESSERLGEPIAYIMGTVTVPPKYVSNGTLYLDKTYVEQKELLTHLVTLLVKSNITSYLFADSFFLYFEPHANQMAHAHFCFETEEKYMDYDIHLETLTKEYKRGNKFFRDISSKFKFVFNYHRCMTYCQTMDWVHIKR